MRAVDREMDGEENGQMYFGDRKKSQYNLLKLKQFIIHSYMSNSVLNIVGILSYFDILSVLK